MPIKPPGAERDEHWMDQALLQARQAYQAGEVPVGAVVVAHDRLVSRGRNRVEATQDATQHAELIALQRAAKKLGTWRLKDCELFVTLEPCAMCAGALVWSRVKRVIFAAVDPKAGAAGSVLEVLGNERLNHRPQITSGVRASESAELLQAFFRKLRSK